LTPSYLGQGLFFDASSRAQEKIPDTLPRITLAVSGVLRVRLRVSSVCFARGVFMTRSGLRRERAIIAVLKTGHIPGQNVTQLEFCDLVRTAARIMETPEGFPRGWSKASIMNSVSKITGSPAMLCERCKTEITLANLLDAEPDVNRRRRESLPPGRPVTRPSRPGTQRGYFCKDLNYWLHSMRG